MRREMTEEDKIKCLAILKDYIQLKGSQANVAREFNRFPAAVSVWKLRRQVPPYAATKIAKDLGVKKSMLRPDIFEEHE